MRFRRLITVAALLFGVGCSTGASSLTAVPPSAPIGAVRYLVIPFEDRNDLDFALAHPEAAEVVQSAFVRALLDRSRAAGSPASITPAKKGGEHRSVADWQRHAASEGIDAVIFGTVHTYVRGSFSGSYTTVGFSVEATSSATGEILWTGAVTRSTPWTYDYDPAAYAAELSHELAAQLARPR